MNMPNCDVYEEIEMAVDMVITYGYVPRSIWMPPDVLAKMGRQMGDVGFTPTILFGLPVTISDRIPAKFFELSFKDGSEGNKWRVWVGS